VSVAGVAAFGDSGDFIGAAGGGATAGVSLCVTSTSTST
jgi:hypothetical protein